MNRWWRNLRNSRVDFDQSDCSNQRKTKDLFKWEHALSLFPQKKTIRPQKIKSGGYIPSPWHAVNMNCSWGGEGLKFLFVLALQASLP